MTKAELKEKIIELEKGYDDGCTDETFNQIAGYNQCIADIVSMIDSMPDEAEWLEKPNSEGHWWYDDGKFKGIKFVYDNDDLKVKGGFWIGHKVYNGWKWQKVEPR